MKCCIRGCDEKAIGTVYEKGYVPGKRLPRGAKKRRFVTRCENHELKYQYWKEKRLTQVIEDKKVVERIKAEDIAVREPQIIDSHDGKLVYNIEARLREIYCE